jgi:hypothetical protein
VVIFQGGIAEGKVIPSGRDYCYKPTELQNRIVAGLGSEDNNDSDSLESDY